MTSASNSTAIILSVEGLQLSDAEKRLFAGSNPLGFILFQRNCDNVEQIRALVSELRDSVGWHCPIVIDQEGGRVQRLKPPHWQQFMPAQSCNSCEDAAGIATYIANDLNELNIDVNCSPVMDLLCDETHDVIGDRAFSDNPEDVFEKGKAVCEAYLAENIVPIVKHLPGHGRATSDSHLELPVVEAALEELEQTDFEPFRLIAKAQCADQTWGMVAHIIYTALDPQLAATVSKTAIDYIRKDIGYDQFMLADDISMLALEKYGNLADRAIKTLESGCDATLYCQGNLTEMESIMQVVPKLRPDSLEKYERSRIRRRQAA